MGRSRALGMDQWFQTWVRPRWRSAQGVPRALEEETIQVRVAGKLQVGVEEKLRQQAGWEQEAMWDRLELRYLK
jgi:hypothetical protein